MVILGQIKMKTHASVCFTTQDAPSGPHQAQAAMVADISFRKSWRGAFGDPSRM